MTDHAAAVEKIKQRFESAVGGPPGMSEDMAFDLVDDIPTLLRAYEAVVGERDDAQSWLASLAYAMNGWLRETGLDQHQTKGYEGTEIRDALDQFGYAHNRQIALFRAQHAALVKLLNEFGESEDPYANDLVANLLATLGEPEGP